MTVNEVRAILSGHEDELRELGVASLAVFGSTARGEAGPESDVDMLVELTRRVDLLDFIGIKHILEDLLGREVDLVMPDALKPRVRERVLAEAVRAA
jgi:hypothetical protein